MRHLGSLILALITGAALLALTVTGTALVLQEAGTDAPNWAQLGPGLTALAAAGALYALLIMPRLSPLGLFLAGLGLAGVAGWALAAPRSVTALLPTALPNGDDARLPVVSAALLLPLSVPLLLTLFSARRWRRNAYPVVPAAGPWPGPYSGAGPYAAAPYAGGQPQPAPYGGSGPVYADPQTRPMSLGYPQRSSGYEPPETTLSLPADGYR